MWIVTYCYKNELTGYACNEWTRTFESKSEAEEFMDLMDDFCAEMNLEYAGVTT
jgi:hypothetical protein